MSQEERPRAGGLSNPSPYRGKQSLPAVIASQSGRDGALLRHQPAAVPDEPSTWLARQHRRITTHELAKHELHHAPPEVLRRTYRGEIVIWRRP